MKTLRNHRRTGCARHFPGTLVAALLTTLVAAISNADEQLINTSSKRVLPDQVTFNAHIRPLMSNTCFVCHGPDPADNESGYRIDSFTAAIDKLPSDESLVGIKPFHPEASEVYRRIVAASDDERMPPKDYRHQLSDYDKALFRKWIEQGANYEQHWSFSPLVRPAIPKLAAHQDKVANSIDAFVLSRLEAEDIEPSEVADRAALLRRLSLDLTGLPPPIEDLNEFLADQRENAYQQQVERLLASKHFGERMASSWLDLVRFADTVGFHGDQNQRNFPYRDYVIDSFNDNKPFDQFTREQLAGDLLPHPTSEQLVATGVLRLNMVTREGGAQAKEYLAKSKADRVRALGTAWMGMTLGCCECHNHKYDPFTAKDFYSLGAFFDDLRQWGVYSDYGYTPNKELAGFNNDFPFPPETRLASPSARAEIAQLQRERDAKLYTELGTMTLASMDYQTWLIALARDLSQFPDGWIPLQVKQVSVSGKSSHEQLDDGSVLFQGQPDGDETVLLTASVSQPMHVASVRLEVLPDERNGGFVGRADDGRFTVTLSAELRDRTAPDEIASDAKDAKAKFKNELAFELIEADLQNPTKYHSGHLQHSLVQPWRSGPIVWQFPGDETRHPHTAVYHLAAPIELDADRELSIKLASNDVGRVRLSVTSVGHAIPGWPAADGELLTAVQTASEQRTQVQHALLVSAFHRSMLPIKEQSPTSRYYRDEILKCRGGSAMSLIAQAVPVEEIPVSRVRPRGNWQDESGELAPPAVPHFLPQPTLESDRRLTRLDLANWLTAADNPLTARHFVNRTWKQFFGTGLSGKLDDLGNQGEWPSHPQLLDWLASEFVDSGWNMKHIIRLMVNSRTYRQAAAVRSDLSEVDPYNRLLAQQSARRLEAEAIRDNVLAISGLLSAEYIGGPSVFPYQPDGHYANIQFPDRHYVANNDFRQYRRGVYMHWQRTFLHPMLVNFDAPSRDECTADRPLSNSPQQALTLLNDPSFVEASRTMASWLQSQHPQGEVVQILQTAFLKALAREPNERETESLQQLYQRQLAYYQANPQDAEQFMAIGNQPAVITNNQASLAAWSQVCRVILNLQETITRY